MRVHGIVIIALLSISPALLRGQTVRLEAEDARLEGPDLHVVQPGQPGSDSKVTGYSGKGFVTGFNVDADRAVFTLDTSKAGICDVKIGFRSNGHRGYELAVNDLTVSGMFNPPSADAFGVQDAGRVELKAGKNTLAVGGGWRFYDIDYIELTPINKVTPPVPVTTPPSDPNATPEARALLKRLDDLYGHGSLMGADNDNDLKYIIETTGSRPVIMESDLSPYSPASVEHNPDHPSHNTEHMIDYAQQGYTITMCWHWVAPIGLYNRKVPAADGKPAKDEMWYRGFYTDSTSFDFTAGVNDPQSGEHELLLRDIDAIAVQLKKFQAANVPILWRPLHESQGGWFWWGARGPQPFVALWRLMYDRLVNVDGVHNLIWVFTAGDDPAWYPGDAYVDVVGIDAYPKDIRDPQSELWTELIGQFSGKKPLAVAEFGGVPDVERMHRLGNDWVYAVPWNNDLGPKKNTPEALKEIYAGDFAIKLPVVPQQTAAGAVSSAAAK